MRKKPFLTFVAFMAFLAAPEMGEGAGGWPGYFLYQGAGARGMALGRTYVALGDDASSVFWNPAALSRLDQHELTFLHSVLFEDTRYDFLGYVFADQAIRPWTFGAGAAQLYSGGFIKRDSNNVVTGSFEDSQFAVFFSAGMTPVEFLPLAVGTSFRMLYKRLDTLTASGWGVDVSGYLNLMDFLGIGVNMQNLVATPLQRGQGTEQPPVVLLAGATARLWENFLLASCSVEKIGADPFTIHAGAEYVLMSEIRVRAGWDQGYPTGGLGLRMGQWALDYAIMSHPDLGLSHRAGASLKFGSSRKKTEMLDRGRTDQVALLGREAVKFVEQKRWREAVKVLHEVLKLDPHDVEAEKKIKVIKRELNGSHPRLAVVDIQWDLRKTAAAAKVVEQLPKSFTDVKVLTFVEESLVEAALKQKGVEKGSCGTLECAVEIGKYLNVEWAMTVYVGRTSDGSTLITARAVSVQAEAIMVSQSTTLGRDQDPTGAVRDLVSEFVRQLEISPNP